MGRPLPPVPRQIGRPSRSLPPCSGWRGAAADVPANGRARQALLKGTGATKSGLDLEAAEPQALYEVRRPAPRFYIPLDPMLAIRAGKRNLRYAANGRFSHDNKLNCLWPSQISATAPGVLDGADSMRESVRLPASKVGYALVTARFKLGRVLGVAHPKNRASRSHPWYNNSLR